MISRCERLPFPAYRTIVVLISAFRVGLFVGAPVSVVASDCCFSLVCTRFFRTTVTRCLNDTGAIVTWCIPDVRAHQSKIVYISTYAELQDAWEPGSVQQSQHFVLTSHIDILSDTYDARPNRLFGTIGAGPQTQVMLSVQVCRVPTWFLFGVQLH